VLRITHALPGELDGTLDPRDYGFDVIREKPISPEEADLRVADLYRRARALSGVDIPKLDPYLTLLPYDSEPAKALVAKHEQLRYPYQCDFGIADLEVDEGVFCPTLTNASPFLFEHVNFKPGERVLDAFAGSGAFGVNAALLGAETVVSFDISAEAIACTRKNAVRNSVASCLEARKGTLGTAITPGETFDLVIANPPLIPGTPTESLETALFDDGLQATTDLIASLPYLLTKDGRCYLLTSDVIDREGYKFDIAKLCRQNGLKISTAAQLHREYESYRVHKIERRGRYLSKILAKLTTLDE
jgi:methylase of polypeptide subunit release factors